MKSISRSEIRPTHSCGLLNNSPIAMGTHVCWRSMPEIADVLGGEGVLDEERVILLQLLAEVDRIDRRDALVDVVEQLDLVAAGAADVLEHLDGALDIRPDFHLRIAGHPEAGGFEIRLLRQLRRAVAAALDADVPEALLHRPFDARLDLLEVVAAAMRVAGHREAALAPEQLVDRHVGPLALDVPQGLVQAAQGIVQHRAVAPVGAGVGVLPHVLDAIHVPALGERGRGTRSPRPTTGSGRWLNVAHPRP